MYRAAVLTVSDRVSRGERPDEGGPLVTELLKNAGYEVVRTDVVPDEQAQIEAALRQMADDGDIQLLVTTGGTGFAPRDVTPEATLAVCDRLTPGIPEAMRYASMQITSRAMLSRAQAGIRKGTLILNLPGSPKAARENLEAVLPAISHGLEMLSGRPADCAKLDASPASKKSANLLYREIAKKATACKMQTVASYISRRFFVGNCCKFVVNSSDCQRKVLCIQCFAAIA